MKNNKTKKWAIVAGGLAISAVLVVLISNQFKTPPIEDVDIPPTSSNTSDIVVDVPDITGNNDDLVIPPIEIPEKTETTNGDDDGTEQTIQPDPVKPNPTEDELKDKTQTPSGEKVDLPKTPEEEKELEENPPPVDDEPSNPSGGLPGFDNVPDMGEGENIYVDGMKENGNKVGIMD